MKQRVVHFVVVAAFGLWSQFALAAKDVGTIDFATSDLGLGVGFATVGDDYTTNSGTLSFIDGDLSETITLDSTLNASRFDARCVAACRFAR